MRGITADNKCNIGYNLVQINESLPESFRTVPIEGRSGWRRYLQFVGPGILVSVGYMDPGNWATDLKGGSLFGYALLWVILASNLMAMLLQTLCARLGIATGMDLAQACRATYKRPAAIALWLLCEIAIIACDLAEVIGSAIALNLLLGIPLAWGVVITACDVLLLLGLLRFGFRMLEAVVIVLTTTIFACFAINVWWAQPNLAEVAKGTLIPSMPGSEALLIAVGILGATVMPHNLYLHSSIVQTRAFDRDSKGKREAVKFATIDAILALGLAFFVNAAILVLSSAVFHGMGKPVEELSTAYELLRPMLGGSAATLFAVALLCSGQSSTITGTLAGQIVMEGFLNIRVKPWIRRLITRLLAIVPALILISATGGKGTLDMLVWSQVVLSMQLPFAVFPLVMITSNRERMGEFASGPWLKAGAWVCAVLIVGLNVWMLAHDYGWWLPAGAAAAIGAFALWVRRARA